MEPPPRLITGSTSVEPASIPRATSLLTVVQRVGASFGTVVIALVLHGQLAGSTVDDAFAHAFAWTLGFLAVAS